MTYFSITTDVLLKKRLKLAVVFVHGKEHPEKEEAFQVLQPVVKEILEQMETL